MVAVHAGLNEWIARNLTPWWSGHHFLGVTMTQWVGLAILLVSGFLLGYALEAALRLTIRFRGGERKDPWEEQLVELLPTPARFAVALVVLWAGSGQAGLSGAESDALGLVIQTLLILTLTRVLLRVLTVGMSLLEHYLTRGVEDSVQRRAVHTQVTVPGGIIRALLIVLGGALVLMQFSVVRNVGYSLLASAGVAGVVLGLALRGTAENLLAGVQLALFQPVRLGDVLVIEGEWGTVEEIRLTYVVFKIWDQRRLVVPVTYFLQNPIENWTKSETQLLGTVFLYTDYTVPVEEVREELNSVLSSGQGGKLWDRRASGLVVTSLTAETVELRALVSARNASDIWDLRCLVRERLLAWLRSRGARALPVRRVALSGGAPGEAAAGG